VCWWQNQMALRGCPARPRLAVARLGAILVVVWAEVDEGEVVAAVVGYVVPAQVADVAAGWYHTLSCSTAQMVRPLVDRSLAR
jgi:hypothetical protein